MTILEKVNILILLVTISYIMALSNGPSLRHG